VGPNERQIAGYGEHENDGGPDPNAGWLERQRKWLTPETSSLSSRDPVRTKKPSATLWTPGLCSSSGHQLQLNSLRQLSRNSIIEIVLGIIILGIVGVLGTQHPAIHALENLQQ